MSIHEPDHESAPEARGGPRVPFLRPPRWLRRRLCSEVRRIARRAPSLPEEEVRELSARVLYRERLTAILLLIPSAASAMLTHFGVSHTLSENGGGLIEQGQALAFALIVGVFSWLGWFYLFGLIYRLRGRNLRTALLAATVFVGSIAAVDSQYNMLALSGDSAVQMTLVDVAEHYEERKTAVFTDTGVTQKLLPALEAQAQRFETEAANEVRFGTYSGSPGEGKVAAGFRQVATLLRALTERLVAGLQASETLQGEVAETFATLKAAAYRPGPIRPRVERVSVAADVLDDRLARLALHDYRVSIAATLTSLERIFPVASAGGSAFAERQSRELQAVAAMAAPVAESLRTALADLADTATTAPERVRPEAALVAIRTKWRPLAFQWLAATFISLAPAVLLVILIAAWREVAEAEHPRIDPHIPTDKEA